MQLSAEQFDRVLVLNNIHALETSFLEPADLTRLVERSYLAKTIGELDAFLIAMNHISPHDGINYTWFKKRYDKFAYVDRIVTAEHARGQGHAKTLYLDLIEKAKSDGTELICCEINHEPPNPGSVAFHQKLGFEMVDTATMSDSKVVGYWVKKI